MGRGSPPREAPRVLGAEVHRALGQSGVRFPLRCPPAVCSHEWEEAALCPSPGAGPAVGSPTRSSPLRLSQATSVNEHLWEPSPRWGGQVTWPLPSGPQPRGEVPAPTHGPARGLAGRPQTLLRATALVRSLVARGVRTRRGCEPVPAMTGFMEGDRGSERKPRKTECAIEGSSYPGGWGAGCRGHGHD